MNWLKEHQNLILGLCALGVVLYIFHRIDVQRAEDMARMNATITANNAAMLDAVKSIQDRAKAATTPRQQRDFVATETRIDAIEVKPTEASKPDEPPKLIVPAQPMTLYVAECSTCKVKLATCEENLKVAEQTANGGSRWTRFKRAAKWIGTGVAIGAAGALAAHR